MCNFVPLDQLFSLETILPVEQCRIVKYDAYYDYIERSFDGEEVSLEGTGVE